MPEAINDVPQFRAPSEPVPETLLLYSDKCLAALFARFTRARARRAPMGWVVCVDVYLFVRARACACKWFVRDFHAFRPRSKGLSVLTGISSGCLFAVLQCTAVQREQVDPSLGLGFRRKLQVISPSVHSSHAQCRVQRNSSSSFVHTPEPPTQLLTFTEILPSAVRHSATCRMQAPLDPLPPLPNSKPPPLPSFPKSAKTQPTPGHVGDKCIGQAVLLEVMVKRGCGPYRAAPPNKSGPSF